MHRYFLLVVALLISWLKTPLQAQEGSRVEMAHQLLMNIATDGDFKQSFSLLEKDGISEPGWHQQLLDYCSSIYENDTIPDRELAFADRTLEQLASSEHSPKTVVANASYILGNIAFNARDYHYLQLNIQRLKEASESLPASGQLRKAISTLEQRGEYIQNYAEDFIQRMTGTWMSAENNGFMTPVAIIDIMPACARNNRNNTTLEIAWSPDTRQVGAFFGYSEGNKGNPALAAGLAKAGEQWSAATTRSIAVRNRKKTTVGSQFAMFGSEVGGMLVQAFAKKLSERISTSVTNDYYVTEIYPGIARLDIIRKIVEESSQKGVTEYNYSKSLFIYKIAPEDSIAFAKFQYKKHTPFHKDKVRVPIGTDDEEAYIDAMNTLVVNHYGGKEKYITAIKKKEYLDQLPENDRYFSKSWSNSTPPYAANIVMNQRLRKIIGNRLQSVPSGILDESITEDLYYDIKYRIRNHGVFKDKVIIFDYPDFGEVFFSGIYAIYQKQIWAFPKCWETFTDFELPNELAKMEFGEIPVLNNMEKVYKKLRDSVLPVEGIMTGYDKKSKKDFRYEGEFKDRKFHGKGKLWLDGELVHDGMFENGKPIQQP